MNLDDHALFLAPCLKENEHQKNKAKGKNKKKGLAKTKNEYQNLKKYWSKSSYLKRKNYKDNSVNTKSINNLLLYTKSECMQAVSLF